MVVLKNFKNIFLIPELTKRVLFTLFVFIVYRIGAHIPVSGINTAQLIDYMSKAGITGGLLSYLDTFSGGALQQCSIFALGIGPYITASIVMQMLSMTIPHLEQLSKDGESGRRQINQYTRYVTVLLSITYSSGIIALLEANNLVLTPGLGFKAFFVLCLSTGTMFAMWLSEQISLSGIGNGSSMLIFAGIVSSFHVSLVKTLNAIHVGAFSGSAAIGVLCFFIAIAACIVYLEKGERKIPVQYARRVIGQRVYGGQNSYIPFKINPVNVMPAIFADSMLTIPISLANFATRWFPALAMFAQSLSNRTGFLFNVITFALIVFFTFVYTSILYNPTELADNIKKQGGFIPGIRPGAQTAAYFDYLLTRICFVGALYLAALALLPNILQAVVRLPFVLGGTSLLIVVGVALDLSSQIETYLIEHNYAGFLASGSRLKR